jgi:maleamate amidohydrolase
MSSGDWRKAVPAADWEAYAAASFGQPSGLGASPALLIIDVQYRTVGDAPAPLMESIERYYKTSCGQAGWDAVANIVPLVAAARQRGIPIIYPHVAPKGLHDAGRTGVKIPGLMEVPDRGYAFVAEVAPAPEDLLIPKRHPSAFFATALVSVILTGCTTSGCVRASAVDAFAYNFHCAVVEDAVYDRSQTSHDVNLFDLHAKYADVMDSGAVLDYLAGLPDTGVGVA